MITSLLISTEEHSTDEADGKVISFTGIDGISQKEHQSHKNTFSENHDCHLIVRNSVDNGEIRNVRIKQLQFKLGLISNFC